MTTPHKSQQNNIYIHTTRLNYSINQRLILNNVSCELSAKSIAILGTNGSGKSTFLRLIDGLERRTSGDLQVLGLDPSRKAKELHHRIGFVFTNPDTQIIMPTVAEDVAFSLHGAVMSKQEKTERVKKQLADFHLSQFANQPAHSLSGGQKQMLALAGILIRDPQLLLADEPTTMLDLPNAERISHVLLGNHSRPVIIATHDLELASHCELAMHFHNGQIVEIAESGKVIEDYRRYCSQISAGIPSTGLGYSA
ncbi:energy-coupling factor ABC transporter ATP-binding protein [Bifidobacterium aquikefiri]|uniref:energy-coupling factor ABC transporter ATP-binding protein n=2 Tax=Bifidobacterium aquikefiri TaxID=1653207 RepID=UPI0039EA16C9